MHPRRLGWIMLVLSLVGLGGCSSSSSNARPRRQGGKINIAHFAANPAAYKGKSMSLRLKIDEAIDRNQRQSLRDYVGREVKFTTSGPRGERLNLVINIPADLPVPEAGYSDEVSVTFVCTRGDLRKGNEAMSIETP
jgi:hypothetical protein